MSSENQSNDSNGNIPVDDEADTTTSNGSLAELKTESKPSTASQTFMVLSKTPITTANNGALSLSEPRSSSFSQSSSSSSPNQNTTSINAKTVTPKFEAKTSPSLQMPSTDQASSSNEISAPLPSSQDRPSPSPSQNTTPVNAKTVTPKCEAKTSPSLQMPLTSQATSSNGADLPSSQDRPSPSPSLVVNRSESSSSSSRPASASDEPSTSSQDPPSLPDRINPWNDNKLQKMVKKRHEEVDEMFPGAIELFEQFAANMRARKSLEPEFEAQENKIEKLSKELIAMDNDIDIHQNDFWKREVLYYDMKEAIKANCEEYAAQNEETCDDAMAFLAEHARNHKNEGDSLKEAKQWIILKKEARDEKAMEFRKEEEKYEGMMKEVAEDRQKITARKYKLILGLGFTLPCQCQDKTSPPPPPPTPTSSSQRQKYWSHSHSDNIPRNPLAMNRLVRSQPRQSPPSTLNRHIPQTRRTYTVRPSNCRVNPPTVQGPRVYVPSTSPSPSYSVVGPSSSQPTTSSIKRLAPTKEKVEKDECAEPKDESKKMKI